MKRERKRITTKILSVMTALALLAGSIPMQADAAGGNNIWRLLQGSTGMKAATADNTGTEEASQEEPVSEPTQEITEEAASEDMEESSAEATESEEAASDDMSLDDGEEMTTEESTEEMSTEEASEEETDTEEESEEDTTQEETETEPEIPAPEGYVFGGKEEVRLISAGQQYIVDNDLCYEEYFEVALSGFHTEAVNEGQELTVEVSLSDQEHAYDSVRRYQFDGDGNGQDKFRFCSSEPGEYTVISTIRGYVWQEEDWEWIEEERQQQFTIKVDKIKQKLEQQEEAVQLSYGDTLVVSDYVREKLQREAAMYSNRLEIINCSSDKLVLSGKSVRAVGISSQEEPATIRVRYLADNWFEESQEAEVELIIEPVSPQVVFYMQQEDKWQSERTVQIHTDLTLQAKISAPQETAYEDLLKKDTNLKLQYRIIHEATGEAKEYIRPFGWNMDSHSKTFQTLLPVAWRYFPKLHKGEKYRVEMAVLYEGMDCPYVLPDRVSSQITLQAANAYVRMQQPVFKTDYRQAYGQTMEMPFEWMHKRLGLDDGITGAQELEQIQYELSTSNAKVAAVNSTKVYEAVQTQIPYTITGVGEAGIRITVIQSPTYDIESGTLKVEVANSSIREEDYEFCYGAQKYTFTQWQKYLAEHEHWLNAPVTMAITDGGAEYYDTIAIQETENEDTVRQKGSLTYAQDGITSLPIREYILWMEQKNRGASTQETGDCPVFSMGIDQKAPRLIALNDNAKNRYAATSDVHTWYMGENYQIQGMYEDDMSGIKALEYTTDAGHSWEKYADAGHSESAKMLREFTLRLENGEYEGIGFRAIDMAGNVSEEYRVADKKGDYIRICVDTRIPRLKLQVTKKTGDGLQQDVETWTNSPLHYEILTVRENPEIYQMFYQYIPVWQVIDAQEKGKIPYKDKNWTKLEEAGLWAGADQQTNCNGTFYFKIVSVCGLESEVISRDIRLQQTLPELMQPIISNDQGEDWYHAQSEPASITIGCKAYLENCIKTKEYHAPVTIHTRLESAQGVKNTEVQVGFASTADYQAYRENKELYSGQIYEQKMQELAIDFADLPDGRYQFSYWIEDTAGNRSEVYEHLFNIDTTPPDSLQVWLEGKQYLTGELDNIVYDTFSQTAIQGEVTATDALSGIEQLQVLKAKKFGEWEDGSQGETGGSFVIEPSTRCFLYVVARDAAGNETQGWTNGIVVDAQAPMGSGGRELVLEPAGANANGFYQEDITVDIAIKDQPEGDNYAALESVSYQMVSEQARETRELYHAVQSGVSEEELLQSAVFETKEIIDAVKFEGNEAALEVTATDRAGNSTTSLQVLKIDVTRPEIEITFDLEEPIRERFFNQDRTATIQIIEKNFDEGQVEWEVTRNGEPYAMELSAWSHDDVQHYATMTFHEDGEYTLTVSCKDMADNEAEPVSIEPFCMDQSAPVLEIDYEGASAYRENYYNASRLAVITVEEHNFAPDDLKIETLQPYQIQGWSHEGDRHQLRIAFTQDAHYNWTCSYTDMAGNEAAEVQQQEFYIDSVAPDIKITGVIDNSANSGDIMPVITVMEEHYNMDETQIRVINGKGERLEIPYSSQTLEGGCSYRLPELNRMPDQVYYLTVESLDLAGNQGQLTYRFSLNRNGSAYDMTSARKVTENTYYQSRAMEDIQLVEMNVDEVEQFGLYVSRNGIMLATQRTSNRNSQDEDIISYQVEREGNEQLGYTYTYTLFKENFKQEGVYQIAFYSEDAAGNKVSNTLTGKDAGLYFIIDDTPPLAVVDGVETGAIYDAPYRKVHVMFADNGRLSKALVYLKNDKGEELNRWDYLEMSDESLPLELELMEYAGGQSLTYEAADAAGNELRVEYGSHDSVSDFVITTNPWLRIIKTVDGRKSAIIAGVLTGAAGGAICLYRRRRRGAHA